MCGIFSGRTSIEFVIANLKALRYRGHSAAGFGYMDSGPIIHKTLSSNFSFKIPPHILSGVHTIIGHCRWPSIGKNSEENTHPIVSFDKSLMICHNGTITNYAEIKQKLRDDLGIYSQGDTDTEVAANWLALLNTQLSFETFFSTFEGTWAITGIYADEPSTIFYLVKDSPLYFKAGLFASDNSLFDKSRKLRNGFGYYNCFEKKLCMFDELGNGIKSKNVKIISNPEPVKKLVTQDDKMISEIHSQPYINYHLEDNATKFLSIWLKKPFKSVKLIGCGSSYNAALLGKKYFNTCGIPAEVEYASEYNYLSDNSDTLVIAISQSGETADIKEVMKHICDEGIKTKILLLTNRNNPSCSEYADCTINMDLGVEEAVAATKTFTATCLNLLAFAKAAKGDFNYDFAIDFKEMSLKILEECDIIKDVARKIAWNEHWFCLGTGLYYPVAREGALKLKEVAQCRIEALPLGEGKHGSLALQDENQTNIVLVGDSHDYISKEKYNRVLANCNQITSRQGKLVGLCTERIGFDHFVKLCYSCNKLISPLVYNIVLQLLAYYIAKEKDLNPDYPRSICKAVTVY